MARHVWTVLCEGDALGEAEERLTLMAPIDHLNAYPLPADELIGKAALRLSSPMTLVSSWRRSDAGTAEVAHERIRLLGPDGTLLETYDSELDLRERQALYQRREIAILRYAGVGTYEIEVLSVSGDRASRVALLPLDLRLGSDPNS